MRPSVLRFHLPPIVAAQMRAKLFKTPCGVYRLHTIFRENLERAAEGRQLGRTKTIERAYDRFAAVHPMPRVL